MVPSAVGIRDMAPIVNPSIAPVTGFVVIPIAIPDPVPIRVGMQHTLVNGSFAA